jgi:hypothetical protein
MRGEPTEQRIATMARRSIHLVDVTRIWNAIDAQPEPERLWSILADECPWAFDDPADANTMRFVYRVD